MSGLGVATVLASGAANGESLSKQTAALKAAVRAKELESAQELTSALVQHGDPKAFGAIFEHALSGRFFELEPHASRLLSAVTDPKAREEILRQAREHPNYKTRILLLRVAGGWASESPEALVAVHDVLKGKKANVILAALKILRELKRPESATPVMELLEARGGKGGSRKRKAKSRVYFDALDVLKAVTGKDFKRLEEWKAYLKTHGGKAPAKAKKPRKKGRGRTAAYKAPADFFDIPVNSDRVMFILDISHSMLIADPYLPGDGPEKPNARTEAARPKNAGRGGRGTSGAGSTPSAERVRLRRAQNELVRVIQSLDGGIRFGVMAFNHEMHFWQGSPRLREATRTNKSSAALWVQNLTATGWTRTDRVLESALSVSGADTFYVLTDGAPQGRDNRRLAVAPILEYVGFENRFRLARVHTVSFAQIRDNRMRYLVDQLAKENDGKSVYLK